MATSSFFLFSILFLCFSMALSSSSQPQNFTFELIHRDSPLSPFYNPLNTVTDRLNAAFHRSISRSHRFNQKTKTNLHSGLVAAHGEFLMSITIGTPPVKFLAIVDSGSDLTWVRCKPCPHCFKQNGLMFDKTKSSTYKNEPCNSRHCLALYTHQRGCDESKNVCKYDITYEDESFSKGDVATETISINSVSGSSVFFPGTVFGCGYNNNGSFDEIGSGIIGLGGGELSLISQLSNSISKKFSYCLTHSTNGKSFINLGTNSFPSRAISTPLVDKEPKTFHYLTLEAISVGKTKIPYTGNSVDGILSNTPGNIVIDSGSSLTVLDSGFFDRFGATVDKSVKGAKRVNAPSETFTHCYRVRKAETSFPEITMHFTGADVKLSTINAFVEVISNIFCMSMIPTTGVSIYGNRAQLDFLVGYDLEKRTVSFQRKHCSTTSF